MKLYVPHDAFCPGLLLRNALGELRTVTKPTSQGVWCCKEYGTLSRDTNSYTLDPDSLVAPAWHKVLRHVQPDECHRVLGANLQDSMIVVGAFYSDSDQVIWLTSDWEFRWWGLSIDVGTATHCYKVPDKTYLVHPDSPFYKQDLATPETLPNPQPQPFLDSYIALALPATCQAGDIIQGVNVSRNVVEVKRPATLRYVRGGDLQPGDEAVGRASESQRKRGEWTSFSEGSRIVGDWDEGDGETPRLLRTADNTLVDPSNLGWYVVKLKGSKA